MKKQKGKRSKRSRVSDASLVKNYNSKIRQEYLDLDYINKLDETTKNVKLPDGTMVTEKEYMSIFMAEWNNAQVGSQKNAKKNKLHRTKKLVKELTDQNNKRNNDIFGVKKATQQLVYSTYPMADIENDPVSTNYTEDTMIDLLDNMVKLSDTSDDTNENGENT